MLVLVLMLQEQVNYLFSLNYFVSKNWDIKHENYYGAKQIMLILFDISQLYKNAWYLSANPLQRNISNHRHRSRMLSFWSHSLDAYILNVYSTINVITQFRGVMPIHHNPIMTAEDQRDKPRESSRSRALNAWTGGTVRHES